jgi:hypothetical protein
VEFTEKDAPQTLRKELSRCIRELISKPWQPFIFPPGKHPREAYRFFVEPTETLLSLARAYNYVDSELQQQIRRYVDELNRPGGALDGPTGRPTFETSIGDIRSLYDISTEQLFRVNNDIGRRPLARLYSLWLWAHVSGDWSQVERRWPQLRPLVEEPPNAMEEDCRNGYVAGLIAYCRMARRMRDDAAVEQGLAAARKAMRECLTYELAHTRGGLITQVPVLRSIISRWRHLSPEVGHLCANYALQTHKYLMDTYVDYHRPTWYLAWNVETMWRNECPFSFPTLSAEVFAARALILREPGGKLERFLDIPWCKADLFYIQKLVYCIEAYGQVTWVNEQISQQTGEN